jgi:sporulation protein YlmC with PRC-barrel domain
MNSQIAAKKVEVGKHDFRIRVLLEKLKNKLKNFTVLDRNGHILGEVKDVKLDGDRQLNLVVVHNENSSGLEPFYLRSKYIQQVDSVTKSLFVDVSKADLNQFSVSERAKTAVAETTASSSTTATLTPEVVDRNVSSVSEASWQHPLDDTVKEIPFHRVASGEEIRYHAGDTPTPVEPENNHKKPEMEGCLSSNERDVIEEEVIRLLAERLIVDRSKRKVGEIVVRKQVETRMVEVPVRYEKLIVEQVGSENKQLAEIVLGAGEVTGIELLEHTTSQTQPTSQPTVTGEFRSPKSASLFLNAIALQRAHGCAKVRVELVLENPELEKTYQEWFNRCSGS